MNVTVRLLADALCNLATETHRRAHGDGLGCPLGDRYRGIAGRNGVACDQHQAMASALFTEMAAITDRLQPHSSLPGNT